MFTRRSIQRVSMIVLVALVSLSCSNQSTPATSAEPTAAPSAKNQPPVFPETVSFESKTELKYDGTGLLMGGVTTITILTPAIDPDGDELIYYWTGTDYQSSGTQFTSKLEYDGLTAEWSRTMDMGQFSVGILVITASDNKGGQARHKLCIDVVCQ